MKTLLTFVFLLSVQLGISQITIQNEVLASSGGNLSNGSLSMDFTFGETITSYYSLGSANVVTQGFQQPMPANPISSVHMIDNSGITVYPNPFSSELTIEVSENRCLLVSIIDNTGRVIIDSEPTGMLTTFDLSDLLYGNYLLILTDDHNNVGRIPITKVK